MFTRGINYPWGVVDTRSNYGCDFGRNVWGAHSGVTSHVADVRRDFEIMSAAGVDVVRWFVFTDGRGGVRWTDDGLVAGLAEGVVDDVDELLGIACDTGIRLCLVLFDYLWMVHRDERTASGERFVTRPRALASADGREAVLETLVEPLLTRYGRQGPHAALGRAIHSFDVINEPDWVTRGLALDRSRRPGSWRARVPRPFSREELRALVGGVATRVHTLTDSLVTVGGGRTHLVGEWDHPAYGLDFIQVHLYPDVRHLHRDRAVLTQSCDALQVSKPVLIGECPASGSERHPPDHQPAPYSLADYIGLARRGGYLGAWPWSFKGVDGFGGADVAQLASLFRSGPASARQV